MRPARERLFPILFGIALAAIPLYGDVPEADRLLAEGERLAWLKNWQAAEPYFARAEAAFRNAGNARNALYAEISRLRGELPKLSLIETSELLAEKLEDPLMAQDLRLRLRCLVVKGDVDLDLDTELAERDWAEALEVATKLKDAAWMNRASGELGIISFLHGDSRKATLMVAGALTKAQALNDVGAQIRYLTLIGDGLVEWQRYEPSLKMFDQAIDLARKTPGLGEPVMAYAGKATALVSLGRAADARTLLQNLIKIARQKQAAGYESEALEQLGKLEEKAGNPQAAVNHLRQAVARAQAVNGYRLITDANLELSRILLQQRRPLESQKAAAAAVNASRRTGDRFLLPRALAQLAAVAVSRRRFQYAENLFEQATDIVNGMLSNTASANAKSSVVASMDQIFLGYFGLEADQLKNPAKAFQVIEEARGRSVADSLRYPTVDRPQLPASLSAAEKEVSRLQLRLLSANATERRRLLDDLFRGEQRIGLAEASAMPSWLQQPHRPVPLSRVESVLAPDEVLIEYVLDEPASHCLAIERSGTRIFKLPGRSQLEKQVHLILEQMKRPTPNPGAAEVQLYTSVIGPVISGISTKQRIVVVADGPLYDLPFEVLGSKPGTLLLASHVVTYVPSATVYAMLSEEKTSLTSLPVLAVGTGNDGPGAEPTSASGKPFGSLYREVFETDLSHLVPLTAANGEARLVAGLLGPGGIALTGPAATESALKKQPLDHFRVLHFAVHGLISAKFPDRSALLLYPDPASEEDGFWQAREVARTKLNAELVTLSACDVGSGQPLGEEGVANLVRPFLMAGARTVVSNIWESNDDFTHGLMREFYTRLAAGVDKGKALQEAKLAMMQKFGADATPRLWAGFIMVGESRRTLGSR
ncbi:MAG TPA: CHAT domain-containing tetratricopeptide repeat protein [Bryobacteraceae bacterium]|nr:CHAT domain-containing tetratricopeptide repeat protein [Bryobacteraceae bacterium]